MSPQHQSAWGACSIDAAGTAIDEAEHLEQHFRDMMDLPGVGVNAAYAAQHVAVALAHLRKAQAMIPVIVDAQAAEGPRQ